VTVEALARDLGSICPVRRNRAVTQLVDCGEPAVPTLIPIARRWWGRAPAAAIEALGRIGDPRACDVVRRAIGSPRRQVWQAAVIAAGQLEDTEAGPILCGLCATPRSDRGRSLAAWSLGRIGSPKALSTSA
jgi:HEAT repeat protein